MPARLEQTRAAARKAVKATDGLEADVEISLVRHLAACNGSGGATSRLALTACGLDAGGRPGSCQKHDQIARFLVRSRFVVVWVSTPKFGPARCVPSYCLGEDKSCEGFALPGHTISCGESCARAVGKKGRRMQSADATRPFKGYAAAKSAAACACSPLVELNARAISQPLRGSLK